MRQHSPCIRPRGPTSSSPPKPSPNGSFQVTHARFFPICPACITFPHCQGKGYLLTFCGNRNQTIILLLSSLRISTLLSLQPESDHIASLSKTDSGSPLPSRSCIQSPLSTGLCLLFLSSLIAQQSLLGQVRIPPRAHCPGGHNYISAQ